MLFRSRFKGELVLTKGLIRSRRPIEKGETVSFPEKTMTIYGDDIKRQAKKGLLVALDDEARAFVGLKEVE